MTEEHAHRLARLALAGIDREFPNKPGHVLTGPADIRNPRDLHPVFYGHFDWHSSVHGHWMLIRLMRIFPSAPFAGEVRMVIGERFTAAGLLAEAEYFRLPENRSFERMYGWAWALRLALELREWDDGDARNWAVRIAPLEQQIVRLAKDYLPKLTWPVRCGFHPESAFPMGQMLDYARGTGDWEFEELLVEKARDFHLDDRDYPADYEPSGNDFFSAGLNTADLMRRVLPAEDFGCWLQGFLPGLADGKAGNLLDPVQIPDPTDGHLVHLAGLNLSRAWAMRGISTALDVGDPRRLVLRQAAGRHLAAGLAQVGSGHYEGDHWLASFAVYALTCEGSEE